MPDTIKNIIPKDTTVVLLPDTTVTKPATHIDIDSITVTQTTIDSAINTNTPTQTTVETVNIDTLRSVVNVDTQIIIPQQADINTQSVSPKIPSINFDQSKNPLELYNPMFSDSDNDTQAENVAFITIYEASPNEVYGIYSHKNKDTKETRFFTESVAGVGDYFETHSYKTQWLDITSLTLMVSFILILVFTRHFTTSAFSLIVNNRKLQKQFEEDSRVYNYSIRVYFVPCIIIISIYLLFAANYVSLGLEYQNLLQLLIQIILIVGLFSVFKQILLVIVGYVSLSQKFISELIFSRQIILTVATILLFPISILLPLYHGDNTQKILLIIGFIIIILSAIALLVHTLLLFRSAKLSLFLWILYLCILEIAPYLVLIIYFTTR